MITVKIKRFINNLIYVFYYKLNNILYYLITNLNK